MCDRDQARAERCSGRERSHPAVEPAPLAMRMRDCGPGLNLPDISWCGEGRTLTQRARLGSERNDSSKERDAGVLK
jgi:hypothetical protein